MKGTGIALNTFNCATSGAAHLTGDGVLQNATLDVQCGGDAMVASGGCTVNGQGLLHGIISNEETTPSDGDAAVAARGKGRPRSFPPRYAELL